MRRIHTFVPISSLVASAWAAEIVYVTDLTIFTSLAPCVKSAFEYNLQSQTYSLCPEAVTALKDCVCTKNNNLADISSSLSSDISYSCGGTASEDQESARTVLSAYCDQDNIPSFPTPTSPVDVYITDIPQFSYLAPCAGSAVSYALSSMYYSKCPSEAPLLASCACSKNQNSLLVSQIINTSVKYSCSGNTADITSAQAMFKGYCALGDGTSSFPPPPNPPGDMTYYITDLAEYSALAPCAYSALSYAVQYQTEYYCPEGPKGLASCACFKDRIPSSIKSTITASVKYSCSGTDDISSAISVFDLYCSAANAEVTPAGITNSVEESYPTATAGSSAGPGGGGGGGGSGPEETDGASSDGVNAGGGSGAGKNSKKPGGPSVALIAGAVVGVLAAVGVIAGIVVFMIKKKKRRQAMEHQPIPDQPAPPANDAPDFFSGKQELDSTVVTAVLIPPPSPSPSTLKVVGPPGRGENVSPVSAHAGAYTPPPHKVELHGQAAPYPPLPNELHGQTAASYPPMPNSAELHGQAAPYPPMPNSAELYAQGAPYPPPNRPELQGHGAVYPPPPNRTELHGQGSPHFPPPPNRPELAGYYYPQQQQQQQQQHPQQEPIQMQQMPPPPPQGYQYGYAHAPNNIPSSPGQQQQRPVELSPMSWHSGPVPGLHEMDVNGRNQAR